MLRRSRLRRALPLLALALTACPGGPEDPCEVLGEARILDGPEAGWIGPLSNPRPGDAYLANERVQVVVQGPGRNLGVNPWGGNIIDADVRRADGSFLDAFGEVGAFINLAGTNSADAVTVLNDGQCAEFPAVQATGTYELADYINLTTGVDIVLPGALDDVDVDAPHPLDLTTTYTLRPGEDFVRVQLAATNRGSAPVPWVLVWLAEAGLTKAFVPADEGWALRQLGGAEYMVFAGPDVAYGILPLTDTRVPSRGYVSLVGAYAVAQDRTVLDIFGYPDSADTIQPGSTRTAEMAFVVGRTHAEVTATIGGLLGEACTVVSGTLTDGVEPIEDAWVSALLPDDGDDLARETTDVDGRWSLCLPPGPVELIAGQEGRPYAGGGAAPQRIPLTVAASGPQAGPALTLPPTGSLFVVVNDAAGEPLPSRVTVLGVDPSPASARLDGDGFDPRPPGIVAIADTADGRGFVRLEPGEYDAVFTRGPEYTLFRQPFSIGPDEELFITAELHRVVDTTGHLSGDFHVHAEASPDSLIPNVDRVTNMAAEGVEILVSTDHAFVTDYAPVVDDLGLGAWLTTVPGQEITTFDYGHFNGFPLPVDPAQHNGGAIDWPGMTPPEIAATLTDDSRVFQVNHPRAVPAPGEGNYFNNVDLQFDADGPYVGADAIDPVAVRLASDAQMLDSSFVAVEVMTWLDVQGLHDWFNFLNAGVRFTATANSDTHTRFVESSGWPRNYVRTGGDDPAATTPEDLVLALQSGRNTLSFGPFVTLQVGGAGSGDTATGPGEQTATVTVQAPPWIPLTEVTLLDGATNTVLAASSQVQTVPAGGAERLQIDLSHTWTPTEDTWLIALATGGSLFPGVPYNTSDPAALDLAAIRAGAVDGPATAFGVTNPVFVDADGDGQVTPSHLVLPPDWESWRWEDRTHPY